MQWMWRFVVASGVFSTVMGVFVLVVGLVRPSWYQSLCIAPFPCLDSNSAVPPWAGALTVAAVLLAIGGYLIGRFLLVRGRG